MTDTRPTHLVALDQDGKYRPVCGARRGKDGDGLPIVAVEHAQAHIDGRGMVPCPACAVQVSTSPVQLALEVAS